MKGEARGKGRERPRGRNSGAGMRRRNVEQCVRTTPFRESRALQSGCVPAAGRLALSVLSIPFHKASRPPFDDEDNDYDGPTTRRRDPAPFRSSRHPPFSSPTYLPAYQSLILPLPYLEPTTYTTTRAAYPTAHFLASPSWPLFFSPFLSCHLSPSDSTASFLPVLLSVRLSPPPSLLLPILSPLSLSLFLPRSLASSRVLSPAVHPLTLVLSPASPCPSRSPLLLWLAVV